MSSMHTLFQAIAMGTQSTILGDYKFQMHCNAKYTGTKKLQ